MAIPAATTSFLRSIINHDAVNNIQRLAPTIIKVRKHWSRYTRHANWFRHIAMGRVSEEFRWRIVALHEDAKWSYNRIALHFHIAKSSERNQIKHGVKNRKRSERPLTMDEEDGNFVPISQGEGLSSHYKSSKTSFDGNTFMLLLNDIQTSAFRWLQQLPTAPIPSTHWCHRTARVRWRRQHRQW